MSQLLYLQIQAASDSVPTTVQTEETWPWMMESSLQILYHEVQTEEVGFNYWRLIDSSSSDSVPWGTNWGELASTTEHWWIAVPQILYYEVQTGGLGFNYWRLMDRSSSDSVLWGTNWGDLASTSGDWWIAVPQILYYEVQTTMRLQLLETDG
jgi:hypothetical protein